MDKKLLTPGPLTTSLSTKEAMLHDWGSRDKEFIDLNNSIRLSLKELCEENKLNIYYPPVSLCGDNAAMIGWACLQRFKIGYKGDINFRPRPRWSLNEMI